MREMKLTVQHRRQYSPSVSLCSVNARHNGLGGVNAQSMHARRGVTRWAGLDTVHGSRVTRTTLQVITVHKHLCCIGVLCTSVKLLTDLHISGCAQNAFGGRGLRADPLGSYSAAPDPLAVIRGRGNYGV